MTLYVTYKKNGALKRATLSQAQYESYQRDPSISQLEIHPSQYVMEQFFNEQTGRPVSNKQLLHG